MQLLSQTKAKQTKALHQKKNREESKLFLVEGAKVVLETIKSNWEIDFIVISHSFHESYKSKLSNFEEKIFVCSEEQLSQISTFKTNNAALAVVKQKKKLSIPDVSLNFWLVLESISDPGNLGTIIRLADWFGLKEVITIGDGVEWHNPKVISASMGSFLRIKQVKTDVEFLLSSERKAFIADMSGQNLYNFRFPQKSMLVIGNEAKGISEKWLQSDVVPITIPSFGQAESLNAAIATGILLNHYQFGLLSPLS